MNAARKQLQSVLSTIVDEVDMLPEQAIRELLPVLHAAELELADDLTRWLSLVEDGEERFTAQRLRVALVEIRSAIQEAENLQPAMSTALTSGARVARQLALSHVAQQVAQHAAHFPGETRPIPIRAAAEIAHGRRSPLELRSRLYTAEVKRDIRLQLSLGVVRGENFDQLTRRLMRRGGQKLGAVPEELSDRAPAAARGMFQDYRYRAERVVRTEVLSAYNSDAQDEIVAIAKEDPDIRQRWDATLDSRICLDCRELHGEVRKVGETFTGGYDRPPLHPNCRCAVIVWREDWG